MVTSENKIILSSGRFSGTSRDQLTKAFDAFRASPQKDRLVLHFHGGLVSLSDAEAIATRLLPLYRDKGLAYPLFTLWESGAWEVLRNNWQEIVEQDVFPRLVERVLQFVWGKLDQAPSEKGLKVELPPRDEVQAELQKARVGQEPLAERRDEAETLAPALTDAEERQFSELLAADPVLAPAASRMVKEERTEFSPEIQRDIAQARKTTDPNEKGLIESAMLVRAGLRILGRCLKRFATKRHHGIYTTVVEEVAREIKGDLIGGVIWKHMKKDTADSFAGPAGTYGGSAILEEIGRLDAASARPRIVLVGHSTGAVYICYFLQAAHKVLPPEVKFDVVFLAPACSFKLLDETLTAAGGRLGAFRSFGMQDDVEIADQLFAPVYLRSLLYFVSGLVEVEVDLPLVGMARYHSGTAPFSADAFPEIARVRKRLEKLASAWLWSQTEIGDGLNTTSIHHADFDDDEKTLASVAYCVAEGFAR
jgi:hypothetical protein